MFSKVKRAIDAWGTTEQMIVAAVGIITLALFFQVGDSFNLAAGSANTTYYFIQNLFWTVLRLIPIGVLLYIVAGFFMRRLG